MRGYVRDSVRILHYNSNLRVWFDIDISFEVGGGLSAAIMSLPRLVTLRSNEKLSDNSRLTSNQSVKLTIVERAMLLANKEAVMTVLDTLSFVTFNPLQNNNLIAVRLCRLIARIDE